MIRCEICRFENPAGHSYCGRCGSGLSASGELEGVDLSGPIEGERKQVTIIFADISGFTALNDAAKTPAQVEQVLQIANHVLNDLSEIVYEYDGYIDKFMGDAIMALFGAPVTHENDPERALRAVLDMMKALDEFNRHPPFTLAEPLGIHMGINTGTVIAGLVGTKRKRSYTVMGDVVNVASRLESVSERGEILVSEATYALTKRHFLFKKRDPVRVKGKKEALPIYQLIGERTQSADDDFITELIGRETEMQTLRQQLSQLRAGRGGITAITGEAGLGKSRLVSELQQEFIHGQGDSGLGVHWFEGRGLSYRQNVSYKLFIEIMRQYLGAGQDDPPEVLWLKWQAIGQELLGQRTDEVVPYLATLMGIKLPGEHAQNLPLSEPQVLQQRMFVAVGEWIETLAAQQPVVLVFEDLHWADSNSVHLIEYLMTITPHLPVYMFCLTRPERETDFWAVNTQAAQDYPNFYTEIWLEPLDPDESQQLMTELLENDHLPRAIQTPILKRTEGNPLFMEEVVKSLIEDGTLTKRNGAWHTAVGEESIDIEQKIPNTLTGVLTARIDRLGDEVKRTLQIAAVIGRTFQRSVLDAVADDDAKLDDHLTILLGSGLLRKTSTDNNNEETYTFRHALTHETVYNNLLLQQRRIYHKKIADYMAPWYYLRGEEYASVIAHHYVQGETWERAAKYLIRAAEASRNTFDNDNAVHYYSKALETLGYAADPEAEATIYAGRGKILKRLGRIDEARADFEKLLALGEETENASRQMAALVQLGKLRAGSLHFSQAEQYFANALDIARQAEDKTGIVDTLTELGEFKLNMGHLAETAAHYNEALVLAQELGRTPRIASCEDGLATVKFYQGDIDESIKQLHQLERIWRDIGNHQGLLKSYSVLAMAYTGQGQYEASNQICRKMQTFYERTGDQNWTAPLHIALAQNELGLSNLGQAVRYLHEAMAAAQKLSSGIWQSAALSQYGYSLLILGEHERGHNYITQALSLSEKVGSPLWESRIKIVLGVAQQYQADYATAEETLKKEATVMQELGYAPFLARALHHLIGVYLAQGKVEAAEGEIDRFVNLSAASGMRAYQAKALHLKAQIALAQNAPETACDLLKQAQDIADSINNLLLGVEIALIKASAHLQYEDAEAARENYGKAQSLLNSIAESIPDPALRASFQNGTLANQLKGLQTTLNPS